MTRLSFSNRVPTAVTVNRLSNVVAALRARNTALLDLTVSNPTAVGLPYPLEAVRALADDRALRYDPHPFGLPSARAAVALETARHGAPARAQEVVLTASTSEAYSFLLKLFCDPGDEVLVPVPSYPLFEHLAKLDGVTLRTYPLEYHGVWSIDLAALDRAWGARTRALIVVTPNNPTGSFVRRSQWNALTHDCAARGVPLICDEVFADYALEPAEDAVRRVLALEADADAGALIVSLGGLSKSAGLPQHKLGWIVLRGPVDAVDTVRGRLEWIADTYLSVNVPVQAAVPRLLAAGAEIRASIASRTARNLAMLRARVQRSPACEVLRVEGGWSAVVRVPSVVSEETLVLELAERDHVLVHPGFFFDFPRESFLVTSLLPDPATFDTAVDRLCKRAEV